MTLPGEQRARDAGLVTMIAANEYRVRAGPETVHWGYLSGDLPPVLAVLPGATVTIETVSHEGLMPDQGSPIDFFSRHGIAPPQVLADAIEIYARVQHSALGPHIVTGPIQVTGAEPGDVLCVDILAAVPRVAYGVNSMRPSKGALADEFTQQRSIVIPLDLERGFARFAEQIHVPLRPFFGILATAPPLALGRVNSVPPGAYGGNLDIKHLVAGTTLYLPVHVAGAGFMAGDGHAAQGNGEVDLTAIETSMTGSFRLNLLKRHALPLPRAETPTHWITLGLHEHLDQALRIAVRETLRFLVERLGLSRQDAYALASIAIDFEISQAVNGVKGVHAMIPKAIFQDSRAAARSVPVK